MGNGMNKVLPGLYVGNYRDSKDHQQLERHRITHIVAIHDSPRRLLPDKHYLCIMASDTPDQNLSQYFSVCNDFIHAARLRDGNVLIHCLAGMSRSVTVAVAYIMCVTHLSWKESLKVVRTGRAVANPNMGFQTQLNDFEMYKLVEERKRLRERFPTLAMEVTDRNQCAMALNNYAELLSNKDICEGNCVRGQSCPTGLCNTDTKTGIFRRKSSTMRSRLASVQSSSCPASPREGMRAISSEGALGRMDHSATSASLASTSAGPSSTCVTGLQRSASTVSNYRPRSSPSGLYSYTESRLTSGSAPSSIQGSRVDLSAFDRGSAIYLGCSPPKHPSFPSNASIASNSSSISMSRLARSTIVSGGSTLSPHNSPNNSPTRKPMNRTPPISPKRSTSQTRNSRKSTPSKD